MYRSGILLGLALMLCVSGCGMIRWTTLPKTAGYVQGVGEYFTARGLDLVDIAELTFKKPKARDLLVVDEEEGSVAQSLRLVAQLSGISYKNILALDGEDAMLCATVAGTMGKKSATGGT